MYLKRVGILSIILYFSAISALAVEVNSYDELLEEFNSETSGCEIDVECNIQAHCPLGAPKSNNVVIHGHDNVLDGNGYGGIVLNNNQSLDIDSVNAQNFHASRGSVLDTNSGCHADLIKGNFYSNSASMDGGVLFNSSNISDIVGDFSSNTAGLNGGAIYNDTSGVISAIQGTFSDNTTRENTGGAVFNFGQIGNIEADFSNNRAERGNGGAIVNFTEVGFIKGNFTGNYAGSSSVLMYNHPYFDYLIKNNIELAPEEYGGGGAIMNYGNIEKLSGTFIGNKTEGLGGAIRNSYGTINIVSDEEDVLFTDNIDANGANAIHNDSGIINMTTGDYDIIFNDSITGSTTYIEPVININQNGAGEGKVVLNNDVSGNIVNMYGGTLNIGEYGSYEGNFTDTSAFNFYGGTLDLRSEQIRNYNLGNLTLFADMDLKLDGSFEDLIIDTITADFFNSNGHNIDISDITLRSVTEEKKFAVSPIGEDINENVKELLKDAIIYTAGDVINSPIYRYKTWYDAETGLINFERLEEDAFSPPVYAAAVAAQIGGYLQQLNTYEDVFRRMSTYMLMPKVQRLNMKFINKYADAQNNGILSYKKSPYSVFEKVPLKNGYEVSNTAYGTLGGIESEMIELPHNWDFIGSIYAGYNGSHQAYQGVGINQNGGTLGVLGMAYKDNFFTGLTANVASNGCEADSEFGRENFSMLMSGIASKTGYNFEFADGKFIIQPNYLMSYTFVNAFSYNNASGVYINTKPLNAIQIAPGVQFIGNFKNGWQPYLGVNMVWNIIDKTEFKANDVSLPNLSVKPFVAYGLGVRKLWGERFTGFIQALILNGGRNGVALQAGVRVAI